MNWLKARRKKLGLSQEDLTARLQVEGINISRSGLSAWETGRNNPPLEDATLRQALGRILRLSENDLLTEAGFVTTSHEKQSREAELAANIVERLSPEKREMALRILEALEE